MPVETIIWLAVNLLVGLLTLLAALFVTRTPEMTDATDAPSSGDRRGTGNSPPGTGGDESENDSTGDGGGANGHSQRGA